jgi:hypothetical protein
MRSVFLIVFITIYGFENLYPQNLKVDSKSVEPKTLIRLSLLAPGLIVEQKLSNKYSLVFNIREGISYTHSNMNGETSSTWNFNPYFTFEPRFYINTTKIKIGGPAGVRTYYLFGNYIGIPLTFGLRKSSFSVGPVYGIQKMLGKKGFFNIGLGIGIYKYNDETITGIIGDFGLGFSLN